jgi:hypothetical protein
MQIGSGRSRRANANWQHSSLIRNRHAAPAWVRKENRPCAIVEVVEQKHQRTGSIRKVPIEPALANVAHLWNAKGIDEFHIAIATILFSTVNANANLTELPN